MCKALHILFIFLLLLHCLSHCHSQTSSESAALALEEKDVRLPAGSVVLAVVDEAGSLVPLPQFQVDPHSLPGALDHPSEEDVDVETVSEKTPGQLLHFGIVLIYFIGSVYCY